MISARNYLKIPTTWSKPTTTKRIKPDTVHWSTTNSLRRCAYIGNYILTLEVVYNLNVFPHRRMKRNGIILVTFHLQKLAISLLITELLSSAQLRTSCKKTDKLHYQMWIFLLHKLCRNKSNESPNIFCFFFIHRALICEMTVACHQSKVKILVALAGKYFFVFSLILFLYGIKIIYFIANNKLWLNKWICKNMNIEYRAFAATAALEFSNCLKTGSLTLLRYGKSCNNFHLSINNSIEFCQW